MHRAKLKNNFNKDPSEYNKKLYNKQRNFCVSLRNKEKRNYYNTMDTSIFDNNRKFWQRIKPLFSNKQKGLKCDIIITKDGNIITNKHEVAEQLNIVFAQAVDNLEIGPFAPEQYVESNDDIANILKRSHPSVIKIKENVLMENEFSFRDISSLELEKAILNLDITKASVSDDISTRTLVGTYEI